jgi:hypothetical protein
VVVFLVVAVGVGWAVFLGGFDDFLSFVELLLS